MKIKSLKISNYKRFKEEKTLNFNDGINLIVGKNGCGKTTLLQIIASILGTATEEINHPSQLKWAGYDYELLGLGAIPKVEMTIKFSQKELSAVDYFYLQMKAVEKEVSYSPNRSENVNISFDYDKDKLEVINKGELTQFQGYSFVKQLLNVNPNLTKSHFKQVGSIYWYPADRNNSSVKKLGGENKLDTLRTFLLNRYRFHQRVKYGEISLKDDQRDIYQDLSNLYSKVFQGKIFDGSEPRRKPSDAFEPDWFFIKEGDNKYEISEMSGGEQAILPILIDFANLKINNSIILIDEIELHLHPPLQQIFYEMLPYLGENNQFIITTHSDYISTITDESQIIRL